MRVFQQWSKVYKSEWEQKERSVKVDIMATENIDAAAMRRNPPHSTPRRGRWLSSDRPRDLCHTMIMMITAIGFLSQLGNTLLKIQYEEHKKLRIGHFGLLVPCRARKALRSGMGLSKFEPWTESYCQIVHVSCLCIYYIAHSYGTRIVASVLA